MAIPCEWKNNPINLSHRLEKKHAQKIDVPQIQAPVDRFYSEGMDEIMFTYMGGI